MGFGHRYRAGHDLLLDVPATFGSHGPFEGLKHAGHVILTDFPTKAGIPIPGFSHSGLGHLLEQAGISNGWLQVSLFDTGVGVFAFADGASALAHAIEGALSMSFGTACQTFGMGTVELGFAIATQNPLLLAGGLQNVLAGLVSTWNTFSVYIDPLDLLGGAGTSALLGFAIAHGLAGESLGRASLDALRSGAMGGLYSVSSAFGFGALAGFVVCRLASALAKKHNALSQGRLTVDEHSYQLLVKELCAGNVEVEALLNRAEPKWIGAQSENFSSLKQTTFSANAKALQSSVNTLDSRPRILCDDRKEILAVTLTLPDDPSWLSSVYKSAIS